MNTEWNSNSGIGEHQGVALTSMAGPMGFLETYLGSGRAGDTQITRRERSANPEVFCTYVHSRMLSTGLKESAYCD